MRLHGSSFRAAAVVLAIVLLVMLATPARAEALDVLTGIAIGTLVVAGIILVVYLIVANVHGPRMGQADRPVLVACAESETAPRACWPLGERAVAAAPAAEAPTVRAVVPDAQGL